MCFVKPDASGHRLYSNVVSLIFGSPQFTFDPNNTISILIECVAPLYLIPVKILILLFMIVYSPIDQKDILVEDIVITLIYVYQRAFITLSITFFCANSQNLSEPKSEPNLIDH